MIVRYHMTKLSLTKQKNVDKKMMRNVLFLFSQRTKSLYQVIMKVDLEESNHFIFLNIIFFRTNNTSPHPH